MDSKLTRKLLLSRQALKKKYRGLKRDIAQSQSALEKNYRPITQPLNELLHKLETVPSIKQEPKNIVAYRPITQPLNELLHKLETVPSIKQEPSIKYEPQYSFHKPLTPKDYKIRKSNYRLAFSSPNKSVFSENSSPNKSVISDQSKTPTNFGNESIIPREVTTHPEELLCRKDKRIPRMRILIGILRIHLENLMR
uniref:Uncharacterized protein LOC114340371 n=1 Tax=Diabrotica virgifera virgifera TaxID=50390 RepID=A0A6P7GSX1_DIAVI